MVQLRPDAAALIDNNNKKKKVQEPKQVKEIAPRLVAALVHFTCLCGNLSGCLTRKLLTVKHHLHGDGFACWGTGSRLTHKRDSAAGSWPGWEGPPESRVGESPRPGLAVSKEMRLLRRIDCWQWYSA